MRIVIKVGELEMTIYDETKEATGNGDKEAGKPAINGDTKPPSAGFELPVK